MFPSKPRNTLPAQEMYWIYSGVAVPMMGATVATVLLLDIAGDGVNTFFFVG